MPDTITGAGHVSEHLTSLPMDVWTMAFRAAGAVAGSAISIAYLLPSGRREAVLRLTVGVVAGLVFGAPAGIRIAVMLDIMHHLSVPEMNLMGAAAASLCAWSVLGVLSRTARAYKS